jgi:hypothetical protein
MKVSTLKMCKLITGLLTVLIFRYGNAEGKDVNPFGLTLGGAGLSTQQRISLANDLGVAYFRPWAVFLDKWDERHEDNEAFKSAGFKIIMTVRNNGTGAPQYVPTTPPSDTSVYKKTLGKVLDKYHPELLVVENEENSSIFYTGTPEEYAVELSSAVEVAHSKGIKCTNGGMVSGLVALLVWDNYMQSGDTTSAWDFAQRAFSFSEIQILRSPTPTQKQQIDAQLDKGKRLLNVYRTNGIDYVNFHWYIADPQALGEAVEFMHSATNLQPMINEMGQGDTNPNTVMQLLSKSVELQLPYVVWYSIDTYNSQGDTTAYALQNPDGTLRQNGRAFRDFIRSLTSVEDGSRVHPEELRLHQNYPNPFNPSTTIRFSLPQREQVTLKVFDVLGREVAALVSGELNAGEHAVVFDAGNLPSGVYLYQLTAGTFIQQKKMVVLR